MVATKLKSYCRFELELLLVIHFFAVFFAPKELENEVLELIPLLLPKLAESVDFGVAQLPRDPLRLSLEQLRDGLIAKALFVLLASLTCFFGLPSSH